MCCSWSSHVLMLRGRYCSAHSDALPQPARSIGIQRRTSSQPSVPPRTSAGGRGGSGGTRPLAASEATAFGCHTEPVRVSRPEVRNADAFGVRGDGLARRRLSRHGRVFDRDDVAIHAFLRLVLPGERDRLARTGCLGQTNRRPELRPWHRWG
eukprot:3354756-Prymnesium_polylepis.1